MTLDSGKTEEQIFSAIQQEYKILAEYKMVAAEKISGIYVIPSFRNSLLWFGVIFVRSGYYSEGIFRFSILLPDEFPTESALPTIIFQNDIFHPLICPYTRILDITTYFPVWRKGEDHIWQVLKFLQYALHDPRECMKGGASVSNKEAADLLSRDRGEFVERAKACVEESKARVYDDPVSDDPHYVVFEKFNEEIHASVSEKIRLKTAGTNSSSSSSGGLSWVKEGEFKSLSMEQ